MEYKKIHACPRLLHLYIKRAHTICVEFLYFIQIQLVKYNEVGLLYIDEGALENKHEG